MLRRSVLAVLAAVILLFSMGAKTGCGAQTSDTVAQDTVYTGYWLYYNVNTDKTYARAQFRFNDALGTPLELREPARVTFEGKPLGWNGLLNWHEVELAGQVSSGTYEYTDIAGLKLENTVTIERMIDLPADLPTTLSRNEAFTLVWVGDPIQEGEVIEVVFANAKAPTSFIRVDQTVEGSKDVVIGSDRLNLLPAGPTIVSLRRHEKSLPMGATRAGGDVQTTYDTKEKTVELL